jgi:hypothetical protein
MDFGFSNVKFRNMYHYFIVSSDVVNVVEKLC